MEITKLQEEVSNKWKNTLSYKEYKKNSRIFKRKV